MKSNYNFKVFFIKLISIFLLIVFITTYIYNLFVHDNIDFLKKISTLSEREKREQLKNKIRKEIKYSIDKDRILSEEDAELLRVFLNKLSKEIKTE